MSVSDWLSEAIFCPCNRCKRQATHTRRISLEHVEDYDMWEGEIAHNNIPEGVASMPHHRMTSGRNRKAARLHEASLGVGDHAKVDRDDEDPLDNEPHEDHHMEDLITDFFENREPRTRQAGPMREAEDEEDFLKENAASPLYEGCGYSILRASLEVLNLQTIYGWSNASVDGLLRYVHDNVLLINLIT